MNETTVWALVAVTGIAALFFCFREWLEDRRAQRMGLHVETELRAMLASHLDALNMGAEDVGKRLLLLEADVVTIGKSQQVNTAAIETLHADWREYQAKINAEKAATIGAMSQFSRGMGRAG